MWKYDKIKMKKNKWRHLVGFEPAHNGKQTDFLTLLGYQADIE